jgi:hypothetical protein
VERVAVAPHLAPVLVGARDTFAREHDAFERCPDEVDP